MAAGSLKAQNPYYFSIRTLLFGWLLLLCALFEPAFCAECDRSPKLFGYRPKDVSLATEGGVFVVTAGQNLTLILFGENITEDTVIKFTNQRTGCISNNSDLNIFGGGNVIYEENSTDNLPRLNVSFSGISSKSSFYFCAYKHSLQCIRNQVAEPWLEIVVQPPQSSILPLWAEIIFIIILMVMSGLFSGLNLGLMALDPTTLKIIMESGSKRQKKHAKTIYRVRRHGNYLLCTLLLGNVLVNSTLTVLLNNVLGSGVYAVVSSTIAIVIFGEIVPQAICSRHGLVIGAYTIWITYIFMVLTFPLSFPISLVLNLILGKEIGAVYKREQLLELLKVTQGRHGLERDEVDIISGALEFKKKTAKDVMTKFDDVYCIDIQSVLDFKTMRDIYDSGFSRIPVYEGNKQSVVGLLYVRDLAFVDPDDETPVTNVLNFYNHELRFIFDDCRLDEILQEFAEGKYHMAIVQCVHTETEGDPYYEIIGVVTLEDIVEEILQREIVDETDRFMDNRTLKPRERKHVEIGDFVDPSPSDTPILSSQQQLAIYQFLSTGVEPFSESNISQNMLKRLLKKNIVRHISIDEAKKKDLTLFKAGCPANYFVLVLEGCVRVKIGKDDLEFESRSFSHFGAQALLNALESTDHPKPYIPDFTVCPATDCLVMVITRRQYLAAHNATTFEQENQNPLASSKPDVFTEEWEMAESGDRETSYAVGSGLSPITKLFHKQPLRSRKLPRQQSDQEKLLASGSTSPGSTGSEVCIELNVVTDENALGDNRGASGEEKRMVFDEWTHTSTDV